MLVAMKNKQEPGHGKDKIFRKEDLNNFKT